eukprot:COSAG01_NODE_1981_length_8734_cov_7.301563_8_plen_84_part_00
MHLLIDLLLGTRDFPQGQVTGDRAGRYSPNYMCNRRTISVRSDSYHYVTRWWCSAIPFSLEYSGVLFTVKPSCPSLPFTAGGW